MSDEKKLELLAETLDVDIGMLKPEMLLEDLDAWDSIALISFMALMDDEFGKEVSGAQVKAQKTVEGLLALMEA